MYVLYLNFYDNFAEVMKHLCILGPLESKGSCCHKSDILYIKPLHQQYLKCVTKGELIGNTVKNSILMAGLAVLFVLCYRQTSRELNYWQANVLN